MHSWRKRSGHRTPARSRTRSRCMSRAFDRSWRQGVSHGSYTPFVGSVTGSPRRTEMRLSRILPAVMIAATLSLAGEVTASAHVVFCMYDPPIQVVTPGGHYLSVNNTIYLPPNERHPAAHFAATATTSADGHGGTLITVHVQVRSEEHTSELQSRENLVCRLLLEKKKK